MSSAAVLLDRSATMLPKRWRDHFELHATRTVLDVDGRQVSGPELDHLSGASASGLRSLGVGPGDRVLWQADANLSAIAAAIGILRMGAVLVPAATVQSDLERQTIIDDVDPAAIVAGGSSRALRTNAVSVDPAALGEGSQGVGTLDVTSPDDLALIVYTSGTTGQPKGVMHTHQSLAAQVDALTVAWGWSIDDRLLSALPLFHVHGLVVALFASLAVGSTLILESTFEPERFVTRASDARASMTFCVPTMLHRLAGGTRLDVLAGLRVIVSGSSALSVALSDLIAERTGMRVLERYGMTETLLSVSNPLEGERRPGTVGFALPGVVLDVPAYGSEAELRVSGPSTFSGYWNRPAATNEVLSDGWVATGDIVRVDADGYLVVCGRSKELIISGGLNVYPTEIEEVLCRMSGVADAAVVGRPSDEWGEVAVAYVILDSGAADLDAMKEDLAGLLSPYKRPREIIIVDELPRNALGKLQRHLL
ncbi:MAG: AMP-binding protein [Actinomycetes bacterium]